MMRLLKSAALLWGAICISLLYPAGVPGAIAQSPNLSVEITELNALGFPENVQITAVIRDDHGLVISDLDPDAFSVTEQENAVDNLTIEKKPEINEIIVILDVSEMLNQQISNAISSSNIEFFTQLFSDVESHAPPFFFQATIIVPGDNGRVLQQFEAITNSEDVNQAIANGATFGNRPTGKTKLFEAVKMAIQARPDHVVVLSDGADAAGTSDNITQLVEQAQTNGVTIHALEHRLNAPGESLTPLGQLAEATSGTYKQNPDTAEITTLVETIRSQAAPSIYVLKYHSPLPENDTQTHTVTLSVHLATGGSGIAQDTYTAPLAAWNEAIPTDMLIEASGYPTITLALRPLNSAYRRPNPPVMTATVNLAMGDQIISDTVGLTRETRLSDSYDETAADNVALVLDLEGTNIEKRKDLIETFILEMDRIRETTGIASQMALFVPGKPSHSRETFTEDHGGLLNQSLRNADFLAELEELSGWEVLLTTIERAIEQTDTARQEYQRPGHVVVFTDFPLALEACETILAHARQHGVALHIVQSTAPVVERLQSLAASTYGIHLVPSPEEGLNELVQAVADARPTFYTATFTSPFLSDGQSYPLTVSLDDVTQEMEVSTMVMGRTLARSRLPLFALLPIWIIITLLIRYLSPHDSSDRVGKQPVNDTTTALKTLSEISPKTDIDVIIDEIEPHALAEETTGEGSVAHAVNVLPIPASVGQPHVSSSDIAMTPEQMQRQQTLQELEKQGRQLARSSPPADTPTPKSESQPLNPLQDHDDYWD